MAATPGVHTSGIAGAAVDQHTNLAPLRVRKVGDRGFAKAGAVGQGSFYQLGMQGFPTALEGVIGTPEELQMPLGIETAQVVRPYWWIRML